MFSQINSMSSIAEKTENNNSFLVEQNSIYDRDLNFITANLSVEERYDVEAGKTLPIAIEKSQYAGWIREIIHYPITDDKKRWRQRESHIIEGIEETIRDFPSKILMKSEVPFRVRAKYYIFTKFNSHKDITYID